MTRGVDVLVLGGRPVAVVRDPQAAGELAAVLDVWNRTRAHRGHLPDLAALDFAAACLRVQALAQLLPPAEEEDDSGPTTTAGWLTTAQVAQRLRLTTRAVTTRIHAGTLPAQRVGRQWLIDPREVHRAA